MKKLITLIITDLPELCKEFESVNKKSIFILEKELSENSTSKKAFEYYVRNTLETVI